MRIFVLSILVPVFFGASVSADEIGILEKYGIEEPSRMMDRYLRGLADEALAKRSEALTEIKTAADRRSYQDRMREFFIEKLGGFPNRTPLNARIVDQSDHDGFRLEKVIYESRPEFYVTAALYLPTTAGPHPAVLVPCGHSQNGKAEEAYQRACILLARNGIAALCYDPIGQGERYQILDDNGNPRFSSTVEHTMVGVPAILLGSNTANYRVWDGIRSIDYLTSRSDIDASKIGCTGNSGGGTLTSYIMALDPRVACAAPSCYITSFDRIIHTIGAQDAEQNVHGQIAFGMDHADYLMMRAPRPTLVCAATQDFFDISGTWDAFREAKRFYGAMGYAERVDLIETNAKHGFTKPLREGMVRWMRRWLMDIDEPVVEPEFPVFSEEELQCTPEGQVLLMDGARSVRDLNMQFEMRLGQRRHFAWRDATRADSFARVRALVGVRAMDDFRLHAHKRVGISIHEGYRREEYVLSPEEGISLALLLYLPDKPNGNTHILVDSEGLALSLDEQAAMAKAGDAVISVDLRGLGESSAGPGEKGGFDPHFGADWNDYFLAYMLGKSYVGMRTEDILAARIFVQNHVPEASRKSIHLFGYGEAALPALHAAALEPDLFASVQLKEVTLTWREVISAETTKNQLVNAVHGALQVYDLPDLITSIPPSKLHIISRAGVSE